MGSLDVCGFLICCNLFQSWRDNKSGYCVKCMFLLLPNNKWIKLKMKSELQGFYSKFSYVVQKHLFKYHILFSFRMMHSHLHPLVVYLVIFMFAYEDKQINNCTHKLCRDWTQNMIKNNSTFQKNSKMEAEQIRRNKQWDILHDIYMHKIHINRHINNNFGNNFNYRNVSNHNN